MKIYGKELKFNNNKVYHAGDKPTLSEIGAASSSHTHNYAGSSSAGGNANAAVKLATARAIKIGNTSRTFDGTGNITWTAADIGVPSINDSATTTSSVWSSSKTLQEINASYNTMTKRVEGLEETMYSEFVSASGDTMTGPLNINLSSQSSGFKVTAGGKSINIGVGGSDVYINNTSSGKYLQLKDNGLLAYADYPIYHSGNPQPNRGYRAECQSNNGLHATVDLSNLNHDTYYPVVGTALNADAGYVEIRVSVNLNSGTKPSWATHNNGFTCQFHVLMKPCGWGTNNAESIILDNTYRWATQNPVGYTQMNNASMPCLYLRGGGRYYIYTGEPVTWSVKTSSYTASENTVSPTTSYPGVYVQRPQIQTNLYGDVQCPSPWIKLGSRWLTIDSAAPSASVGDVWIQV